MSPILLHDVVVVLEEHGESCPISFDGRVSEATRLLEVNVLRPEIEVLIVGTIIGRINMCQSVRK